MALFKNLGKGNTRATEIISQITPKEKSAETIVEEIVEESKKADELPPTPPETPPVKEVIPEGATPEDNKKEKNKKELTPEGHAQPPAEVPEIKEPEKPLPPPVSEIVESNVFSYLSEKLNRKIESIEDLTVREEKALDPELKQILDWKEKTGLSLSQWSDYNKDFSKMGDLEVAREILSQKYPGLTSKELDYSLQVYVYNEDTDEQEDELKKGIALKKLAQDGRRTLEKNRLDLVPSGGGTTLTEQQKKDFLTDQAKRSQEEAQVNQEKYKKSLYDAAVSLEAINLQLSDDLTIRYDVSEGDRKTLPDRILNMPEWYNKDGSVNHANIVKDGLKIRDFDSIMKKAYEQGVSVGLEGKIKADKNITIDAPPYPAKQDGKEVKGNIGKVVEKISGGPSKRLRFGRVE